MCYVKYFISIDGSERGVPSLEYKEMPVGKRTVAGLDPVSPVSSSKSRTNFLWFNNIWEDDRHISNPRKYLASPKSLMVKVECNYCFKPTIPWTLSPLKHISSTYNRTTRKTSVEDLVNKEKSCADWWKPCLRKKLEISTFYYLGACLGPYKDFKRW